ncbi:Na/Pi cotransporter family protein [Clostridium polynesiense]|uniref:Na/Pi cotransporter family protein n=1 Tax=Clostridium polynesiense TaxID=1325933 RepID=UPI0005911715|nr:Na/Pi cotransporter family protein [Clostridium polynesiense]
MNIASTIIGLIGGLGLFLYGMKLMGDGLENSAGDKLKNILEKVTSNPLSAVLVGTLVTMVIQSSSATTVMVVGFVNAGLMNLYQAAGIIMGANIGTTITAQLVAFKLDMLAPIAVGVGTVFTLFAKEKRRRDIGSIVLGFGILFMGMGIMSSSLEPISNSPHFTQMILAIGENKFLGILAGLALTAVVQSSSATTGILIALAGTGSIGMNVALPIIFGCNIGTCVTALISSIGTSKTARKAAFVHLAFNIFGTLLFLPFMDIIANIVQTISPLNIKRQIANAHTIFNVSNTIIMIPMIKYLIILVNKIVPGEDEIEKVGPKYLDDRLLETPIIAAGQVIKETIRMATKAKENLQISIEAFHTDNEDLVKKVYSNEKLINVLEASITDFLVKLTKTDLSDKELSIVQSTYHVVNDIERIGDHAENIADLTLEKMKRKLEYSGDALEELNKMYNYTLEALEVAIDSYAHRDVKKALEVNPLESKVDECQKEYRESHIRRLNEGKCNAYSGALYIDVLSNLERIGDHSVNIAESVLNNNVTEI